MNEVLTSTFKTSFKVAWLLIKIYIPFSIFSGFLKYSGFYDWVSPFLSPFMHLIGLPGNAAITLIAGFLGNVYAAIATIPSLDLTFRQITIIGIIIGFSHNLIVESGILIKLKFAKAQFAIFRLLFGLFAGLIMNFILPESINGAILTPFSNTATFSWFNSFKSILITCLQFTVIISVLNFLYEILKRWKYSKIVKQKLQKVSSLMGLSHGALVPWLAGFILGIVYGAGILFQFNQNKLLTHKDACLVTVFMVLAHAIIEDTLVFVVIGANFWWIFITRILLAFIVMKLLSINNLYKKFLWLGLTKSI